MTTASDLKRGMVLKENDILFQVLSTELHLGGGKMGGVQHARVKNLNSGTVVDRRFRPDEKVDVVEIDHRRLEFLYQDGDFFVFMDRETFEQHMLHKDMVSDKAQFLSPDLDVHGLFFAGSAVSVQFPEFVDLKVILAPPPLHEHDSSTPKTVTLENGLEILVPQFIKDGDIVRLNLETGKYQERI